MKQGAFASLQAKLTVNNIQKLLKDPDAPLKSYKAHSPGGLITLGPKLGAAQLPFGYPHFMVALKQKDMFVSRFPGK